MGEEMGKVSNLRGKGAAMCVERAMLAQNLLMRLNILSFYKCSSIVKDGSKEIHSYNLVSFDGKYYIFDASIPALKDNKINPIVAEVPSEVFEMISSPSSKIGYSVRTSHFNPVRKVNVEITYDSDRDNIFFYNISDDINKGKVL